MPDNVLPLTQQKPTVEQALTTIISAVRQLKLNFDEHVFVQTCLEVINAQCQPEVKTEKLDKPAKKNSE